MLGPYRAQVGMVFEAIAEGLAPFVDKRMAAHLEGDDWILVASTKLGKRPDIAVSLTDPQFQLGLMNYALPRLAPMPVLGMNQLQLMQMLPLGGKLALAGRVASATATATGYRAEDVSWDLRTQTALAFYDLHTTDRGLERCS